MTTTLTATIARLTAARDRFATSRTVAPGLGLAIDDRLAVGDTIAQGDLLLRRIRAMPPHPAQTITLAPGAEPYRLVRDHSDGGRHHAVVVRGSATVMLPREWTDESLVGPAIRIDPGSVVEIVHSGTGRHGPVTITATARTIRVACEYQRVYDRELRAARRSRD